VFFVNIQTSWRYNDARNPGNFASLANSLQADASFEPSPKTQALTMLYASRVAVALRPLLHFRSGAALLHKAEEPLAAV